VTGSRSVLIGFADALAGPEVAASLLAAGYRVASFARRGKPAALKRHPDVEIVDVTAPEDDFAECAEGVAAAAGRHDVTMPLDDLAVLTCERGLDQEVLVSGPRGEQAKLALDKRLQLRAAAECDLAVPPWLEFSAADGLPDGWELPLVVKPALAAECISGRLRRVGPRLVATSAEFHDLVEAWGPTTPALVQRWVRGRGAGVFGLAHRGTPHRLSAHRRLRMMNPAGSGSSACASAPVPDELVAPVGRFVNAVGWRGMFMLELLRSGDTWWFMELNGRPWGSLALTRRLGYEYPAWAVAQLLNDSAALPEPPPFADLTCRHLGREIIHLLFVLRGPRSYPADWPSRRATLKAMLRSEDDTAWYNLTPGTRGLFAYDTWRTVVDQTWGRLRR